MTNEIVPVSDRERIALLIEQVGTMEVTDNASNLTASEVLRDLKGLRERLQKRVTDLRRPLREAADAISEEARPFIEDLLAGEQHLNGQSLRWEKEQRDLARAEEAAREAALVAAIVEGRHEDAQQALEAQLVPVERPWRAPGTSLRETWKAEITDLRAYVAWAAPRMHEDRWLLPNYQLLDKEASMVKGESSIPGVKFVSTTGRAVSGR